MTSISSTHTKATTSFSNCRSSRTRKTPYSVLNGSLGVLAALPFLTLYTSAQSVAPKPQPSHTPTNAPVVPSPRPPPRTTAPPLPPVQSPSTTDTAPPTTTTTTVRTFSDNVITIAPGTTKTESSKTRTVSPTGKPYGVIPSGDQNGGLMLTISLAVVFSVLAGLGLVVFCLFRRRSAKRRMHIFGKNHSHDLLEVIGQSHNKQQHGNKNTGAGDDSIRRLSSNEAAALQEMSEQSRQSVRLSRRSSSQSLGQGGGSGSGGHQSMHMLSPRLSTARPLSSSHWSGSSSGPRGNSASNSIVIGSGEYVAGPLESSGEFRNSQYDDYNNNSYGGLPQPPRPLYPGPGGGSSNYNSNEQLLLHQQQQQQQQQQHPFQHPSSYSSADLSRCSSLSTGLHPPSHPQSEPIYLPSPMFRAKTLQTPGSSSSESLSGPPPHRSSRHASADSGSSSLPPHMANAAHLQDHSRPRSMPMLNGVGTTTTTTATMTPSHLSRHMSASMGPTGVAVENNMHPERPYSMMMPLNNSSSNLVIPPSITTRPRSVMTAQTMYPGQPSISGSVHQQQQQSLYNAESPYPLQNYSNSNSNHNSYFPPPPPPSAVNNNEPSVITKRGSGPIVMVAPSPARVSVADRNDAPAPAAPTSTSGTDAEK
ncbi:hypothetical protein EC968_000326 [Mortierella alpina]|nr:hypothetical protein EC968_000326 [Mortierella alpina]